MDDIWRKITMIYKIGTHFRSSDDVIFSRKYETSQSSVVVKISTAGNQTLVPFYWIYICLLNAFYYVFSRNLPGYI